MFAQVATEPENIFKFPGPGFQFKLLEGLLAIRRNQRLMWLWFFSVSALLQFWYTFCLNCPTALHWVAGAKAAVKGVVSIGCTLVAIPSVKKLEQLVGNSDQLGHCQWPVAICHTEQFQLSASNICLWLTSTALSLIRQTGCSSNFLSKLYFHWKVYFHSFSPVL